MLKDKINSRPTVMEVNLKAFENNAFNIQKYIGQNVKIMPIIKANAYGTYINKKIELIENFNIVGVALVEEGIELRKLGYKKDIFILNQPHESEIDKIIEYKLTVGISSEQFIEKLRKTNQEIAVHLEIETGMGRTGIQLENLNDCLEKIKKYSNIKVDGIYTHLSSADIDEEYTNLQINLFNKAIKETKKIFGDIKYIHAAASNGILNFKNSYFNLVRPGIIVYGYKANKEVNSKIKLEPVAILKSKITFLKTVEKNVSISYARNFITKRETKVATIPIGYADGIPRNLSNKGYVAIKGEIAPIIGNICMDSFMVDVSEINDVAVGDEIYIWDNKTIILEEMADLAGTINYEIISRISDRVARQFK